MWTKYATKNGEFPLKNDDFALKNGHFFCDLRYVTSLATVFAALENYNTDAEKLYAWFAEIMVGFIFGSIAGVMSQIMTSLKGNDQVCAKAHESFLARDEVCI